MRLVGSRVHSPTSLGIDLGGRRLAWCVSTETSLIDVAHFETEATGNRAQELYVVSMALEPVLARYAIDEIYIEEPIIGRGVRSSLQLAQMAGAVLHLIGASTALSPTLVTVDSWKKAVCGKGGINKEGIVAWLETEHSDWLDDHCRYTSPRGLAKINQDRADAICISRMAFTEHRHGLGPVAA